MFFSLSGITNPFVITVISSCCALAGSLAAFPLVKFFGRRPLLLGGNIVCTLCMYLFAVIAVVKPGSTVAANFLVACVCIYTFTYGATWGPIPTAVITEIPSNGLRSKTMSMTTALAWTIALLIACGVPYLVSPAYANIGAKLGFIFGSTLLVSFFCLFFTLPETKDRTLEEIDEMFPNVSIFCLPYVCFPLSTNSLPQRIPARSFRNYICTKEVRDSDNHVVATAAFGDEKLNQGVTTVNEVKA